jgi:hypothetical protein
MPQLQSSGDPGVEEGTGRCSNALQCMRSSLCEADEEEHDEAVTGLRLRLILATKVYGRPDFAQTIALIEPFHLATQAIQAYPQYGYTLCLANGAAGVTALGLERPKKMHQGLKTPS